MLKRWFSGLFKRQKGKFFIISIMVLMVVLLILSVSELSMTKTDNSIKGPTTYNPSKTVISGNNISEQKLEDDNKIINNFVDYCNNKQFEEAYDLLSDDCKEILYPNLDKFKKDYCSILFNKKKEYSIQSWINTTSSTTYRVSYMENALATGNYDNIEKYQDYITIINTNGTQKLNINKYIGKEVLYKKTQTNELDILVKYKHVYLEREKFVIEIVNKTDKEILLDSFKYPKDNIILITNSSKEYKPNLVETNSIELTIDPNETKEIELDFIKSYGSTDYGSKIELRDVILDVRKYRRNKESYGSTEKITITL